MKSPVVGYVSLIKEGTAGKMAALNWKPFVYGGLASITAECGTFPIDLTKTRLQIQGQTNDANFKEIRYRGMLHALVRIGREEGLKALYSGIAPAMLRQASYGTIKIGTYQSLKRLFVEHPEDETLLVNVVCGILSGVVSSTIANPTDVLKIRMQAQSSTIQGGMIGNFINIYQQEGARGLWKGVSLTAQRAAIVVGVELPVYDLTKKHLILSGLMGDTVYTHFLSSFTCGLAGALASNPVDVVRTRMMNQRVLRDGRCSGYTGTLDCLLQHETRNGEHPGDKRSTSEDEPPWLRSWIQVLPPRQYEGAVGSLSAQKSFLPSSFPGPLLTGTVTLQLFTSSRCLRIAQNHL
ncbi:kidney mitochondrial carrier protein 1 isoform X2 [Ursus arctos]|uniref:kidney mitochondrial carrier protein 1 isoform X2 n=1 Tax=Ursus arctos TaxID=9644 RepID=UPI001CF87399|nr:kidney mitochondrial carrier protein 1 isoform X2 [Ursus arctos]